MKELKAETVVPQGSVITLQMYSKSEADAVIADLEERHKKEVGQLLIEIAELEKLVETADKLLKQKGGFTIDDTKFNGVKLEGFKKDGV